MKYDYSQLTRIVLTEKIPFPVTLTMYPETQSWLVRQCNDRQELILGLLDGLPFDDRREYTGKNKYKLNEFELKNYYIIIDSYFKNDIGRIIVKRNTSKVKM